MKLAVTSPDALASVREALLDQARHEAAKLLAEATADTAQILDRARREAAATRVAAQAQGKADAEATRGIDRARTRRQARALLLKAQRDAYEDLRSHVADRLPLLRQDPAYEQWREGLVEHTRAILGDDAVVEEHPDGGVIGTADVRRVVFDLPGLAGRVLDGLGSAVEGLWSV